MHIKKKSLPNIKTEDILSQVNGIFRRQEERRKQLHHSHHSKEREFAIKNHHNIVLHRHPGMSSFLPLFQCCTPLTPSEGSTKQTAGILMQQTRQPEPAPTSNLSETE